MQSASDASRLARIMKVGPWSLRVDAHALLDPDAERELQDARRRERRRLMGRERVGELFSGGSLLVAAAGLALLAPSEGRLSVPLAATLVVTYAIASRVKFEVGPCYTVPTQLVFVPMLFALPPAAVPLLIALGNVLGDLPDHARGRHPTRALISVGDAWYSMGPALVFVAAGIEGPSLDDWPVYLGALGAQFALDVLTTTPREWFELGVSPRSQLSSAGWTFAIDALLSPIGLLAAIVALQNEYAFLLVLPLIGLIGVFAAERAARLDGALHLSDAYRGTTMVLADLVQTDDEYTGAHSRGVVLLALDLAERMGLSPRQRRLVEFGALLHDVGKMAVPKEVINKPGPLDPDEWAVVKTHTVEGQRLLQRVGGLLFDVGRIVRSSHERWDGTGYPDGLRGEQIPEESSIIACCDAFSAMTTDRPYRAALPTDVAVEELRRNAGTQFDPRVVAVLIDILLETPVAGRDPVPALAEG
jgi:HD-GYP domain-containing protein (c-di-GMP phosphodiesterase class II)